jgi:hypothetical protein
MPPATAKSTTRIVDDIGLRDVKEAKEIEEARANSGTPFPLRKLGLPYPVL